MIYNAFDFILEGYEGDGEQDAIDCADGMAWQEIEVGQQNIAYGRYIANSNGIDVYYDYGADYYFFCPEGE